jgi:hypothetical protein
MLRPVRPLRRSVDLSRRTSQNLQVTSTSSLLSSTTAGGDVATLSAGPAADTKPASANATFLPPPRPYLGSLRENTTFSGSQVTCGSPRGGGDNFASVKKPAAVFGLTTGERDDASAQGSAALVSGMNIPTSPLNSNGAELQQDRSSALPVAAQRLFTSSEIAQLRTDARLEYNRRRRLQERKEVLHDEEEQRRLLVADARSATEALLKWEKESFEALLKAKSEEAFPLQLLEMRIQARIKNDYVQEDAELRQEGRAAWMEQVAKEKAATTESETSQVERRAASHRFRAALTFIVVQERNMRMSLEEEAAQHWKGFLAAEEASRAESAHRALARFLNTPEQLALAAARERRERRQAKAEAKQRKLFQEQQDGFTKGCHHGNGGSSVFEGEVPRKICGRCRVKWDDELGYYVSLDRAVKTHPPPPSSNAADNSKQSEIALGAEVLGGGRGAPSETNALPSLKNKVKK